MDGVFDGRRERRGGDGVVIPSELESDVVVEAELVVGFGGGEVVGGGEGLSKGKAVGPGDVERTVDVELVLLLDEGGKGKGVSIQNYILCLFVCCLNLVHNRIGEATRFGLVILVRLNKYKMVRSRFFLILIPFIFIFLSPSIK